MVWSLSQHMYSCLCGHSIEPTDISPCLYAKDRVYWGNVEVPVHFSCFALMSQRNFSWKFTHDLDNSISNTGKRGSKTQSLCDSAIFRAHLTQSVFYVEGSVQLSTG